MHLVVVSKQDVAGLNIRDNLLSLVDFDKRKVEGFEFYEGEKISIIEIEGPLIYSDYLDEKLKKYLDFSRIIFASRHRSKDGRKIFTVHVSGNIATADFGGRKFSLAEPDPITMKNYVLALKERLDRKPEFEFTMEVTHHGPSEISTPSAFYEIGSTEEEWRDETAGLIVAESILTAINSKRDDWDVAVSIGGTHYAPRQTEIILGTTFTFGHSFAKYTFPHLTKEFILKALEVTKTNTIVIDEKSTTSDIKAMLSEISNLGYKILKSKEVKRDFKL
jgi:D-aminoacyl-tRNA deacylase